MVTCLGDLSQRRTTTLRQFIITIHPVISAGRRETATMGLLSRRDVLSTDRGIWIASGIDSRSTRTGQHIIQDPSAGFRAYTAAFRPEVLKGQPVQLDKIIHGKFPYLF
ncbi:hypothetical protein [Methanosphaerula palustris]|uniref:hypothetical protein n=1 Tax=Methanosphaerula palustris TaxID=475088 RepID=UPI0011D0BE49|nr:hypothetical protein [Methanosphaerula palustris]